MFTLPSDATDDELRAAVMVWFGLIANDAIGKANAFLDSQGENSVTVERFVHRVAKLTDGGKITAVETINWEVDAEELPIDGPVDIVYRWIPGPATTGKHPGFIGEILHSIPVDGEWSDLDASFYIRDHDGSLSLTLRDVLRNSEDDATFE
jgi:hypothetical protein